MISNARFFLKINAAKISASLLLISNSKVCVIEINAVMLFVRLTSFFGQPEMFTFCMVKFIQLFFCGLIVSYMKMSFSRVRIFFKIFL